MKNLKICQGLNQDLCKTCKRQNDKAETILVTSLTKNNSNNYCCMYYLKKQPMV